VNKRIVSTALGITISGLIGCASTTSTQSNWLSAEHLGSYSSSGKDIDSVIKSENGLVSVSSTNGIQVTTLSGDATAINRGQYEAIESLPKGFAAIDITNNTVDVFSATTKPHKKFSISLENYSFDSLCSYSSMLDGSDYLFSSDGDGNIIQWQVGQDGELLDSAINIRSFFVGPDVSVCVANNALGYVYFHEAAAGIWRYQAEPESTLERELLNEISIDKSLLADISDLVWVGGTSVLLGVVEETNSLIAVDTINNKSSKVVLKEERSYEKIDLSNRTVTLYDALSNTIDQYEITVSPSRRLVTPKTGTSSFTVQATHETAPMHSAGDAADDPAIWFNSKKPSESRILGTNKKGGLMSYDLTGKLLQEVPNGRVNNVDIIQGISVNGKLFDVAMASNRTLNSITTYLINSSTGEIQDYFDKLIISLEDIYGLCMAQYEGSNAVWINSKDGTFVEYTFPSKSDKLMLTRGRSFKLPSQPEGCSYNKNTKTLIAGEENSAVWAVKLDAKKLRPSKIIKADDDVIVADIEGIDIAYATADHGDILIISSQGDNSYVIAEAQEPYSILGKFKVTGNTKLGVDGSSETDGLAVSTHVFNDDYPEGLLVVQDGFNVMPTQNQNFKLISLKDILSKLKK